MRLLKKIGILVFLIFIIFQLDTYANELDTSWANKCYSEFKEIPKGKNPSFQHINCLLTNAAINANIPPEVVKAVADKESAWRQFSSVNTPLITSDGGIGIMQITKKTKYDQEKLKKDIVYNIQAGMEVLNEMYSRGDLPKIKGAKKSDLESWYFPVMAYNGTVHANSPLDSSANWAKNKKAYQEDVFFRLYKDSFGYIYEPKYITSIPFSYKDLNYENNKDYLLSFNKKEYVLTEPLTSSNYFFKKGDKVIATTGTTLRKASAKESDAVKSILNFSELTITGDIKYTKQMNASDSESLNQFVWYPTKTIDGKYTGYISSPYITKYNPTITLKTSSITSNSVVLSWSKRSGIAGYEIYNMNTGKVVKKVSADKNSTPLDLSPATSYKFKVVAYKKSGNNSYYDGYSSTQTVVTTPIQVKNVKVASRTTSSINLTWTKQNGVTGYKVYQYDSKTKKYKAIQTITSNKNKATIKNLKPATSYTFKVRAYKTGAKDGSLSSSLKSTTKPATVTLSSVKQASVTSMKVNWKKVTASTGYQIQYSTNSKFTNNTTKTVTIKNKNTVTNTIKSLKKGKKYYVRVRAYSSTTSNFGSWSATKSITLK